MQSTDPWFPSRPTLSLAGAQRHIPARTVYNWSATLAVELEIAGQRGARRDAATAEREAALAEIAGIERAELAEAWKAYFDVLAAREADRVLGRLESVAERVARAAKAGVERGVGTGVDADLAEAALFDIARRRVEAARDGELARQTLAALVGAERPERLTVQGTLEPLTDAVDPLRADVPEAVALEADSRAHSAQASALRRARVPNPTLSAFVQNDGFNERVLGVGVSLPLPLPEPLGRNHAGAIVEEEALSRRAALLAADRRRAARAASQHADTYFDAARTALATYTDERLTRASTTLEGLAEALEAGRLGPRDAAVIQKPLLDFILQGVEARRALCVASIEVLRWRGALGRAGGAR